MKFDVNRELEGIGFALFVSMQGWYAVSVCMRWGLVLRIGVVVQMGDVCCVESAMNGRDSDRNSRMKIRPLIVAFIA